jgi:anti-anti-sigma factor
MPSHEEVGRATALPGCGLHDTPTPGYPPAAAQPARGQAAQPPLVIALTVLPSGGVKLDLAGEIDLSTTPRLRAALLTAIGAAAPPTEIQVDLAGIAFIDAVGVGALVHGCDAARSAGMGFSVLHARGLTRRLFEIFGLIGPLNVVPADDDAAAEPSHRPGPDWPGRVSSG